MSPMYEITDLGKKGKGMFAAKDLAAGDIILSERPVIAFNPQRMNEDQRNKAVYEQYAKLSKDDKTSFDDLTSFATKEQISTLAKSAGKANDNAAGRTVARFHNNSMHNIAETCDFLGIEIARMNHSCVPNITYDYWDKDGIVVARALQEIKAGTELTISYVDISWNRKRRREHLSKNYGFLCDCVACSDTKAELMTDEVRGRLQNELDKIEKTRSAAEKAGKNADVIEAKYQLECYENFVKRSISKQALHPITLSMLVPYLRILEVNGQGGTPIAKRRYEDGARLSMIIRGPDDTFTKHCKEMLKKF